MHDQRTQRKEICPVPARGALVVPEGLKVVVMSGPGCCLSAETEEEADAD